MHEKLLTTVILAAVVCLSGCFNFDSGTTCVPTHRVGWGPYDVSHKEYDGAGRLTYAVRELPDSGDSWIDTWTYDDAARTTAHHYRGRWNDGPWTDGATDTGFLDERGCLARVERQFSDGVVVCRWAVTYDDQERLTTQTIDGEDCYWASLPYFWPDYRLDACMPLTFRGPHYYVQDAGPPDGVPDTRVVYRSDDHARIIGVDELGPDEAGGPERLQYSETYAYDDAGYVVLHEYDGITWGTPSSWAPPDGIADSRTTYAYDDRHRLLRKEVASPPDYEPGLIVTYIYDDALHRVTKNTDFSTDDDPPDGWPEEQEVSIYDEAGRLVDWTSGEANASPPDLHQRWTYDDSVLAVDYEEAKRGEVQFRSRTVSVAGGLESITDYDNFRGRIPTYNWTCAQHEVHLDGSTDYRRIVWLDPDGRELGVREEGLHDEVAGEVCIGLTEEDDEPEYDDFVSSGHCL